MKFRIKNEAGSEKNSNMLRQITGIIVGAMTFGMVSAVILAIAVFDRNYTQSTQESLAHMSEGAVRILDDWAALLKGVSEAAAVRPDIVKALGGEDSHILLRNAARSLAEANDVDMLAFTDRNGVVLPGSGWNIAEGTSIREHEGFAAALRNHSMLTYEPLGDSNFAMAYASPIHDTEGLLLGAVIVAYDLTSGDFTELIKSSFDVESTLFQGDERVETTLNIGTGTRLENATIIEKVLRRGGTFIGKNKIGGEQYLSVYAPLESGNGAVKGMLFIAKSCSVVTQIANAVMKIVVPYTVVMVLLAGIIIFQSMQRMRKRDRAMGETLFSETQNLVVAAKENAATSQDQSAAVKEIVATMEDSNELSENISRKIKDVSSVANKTNSDVADGVRYLEDNVAKLREIAAANVHTIDGIKELGSKIENIWDIVTLINSVADQAKIIAFNAELEASAAGEAGKNFHIVATEIRRLADGIIDGTKEIKEHISEIQDSSDSLILASESGTEKINSGVESAAALSERFESIKNASEITADSAGDITTIIQQQTIASEQILITLKQIAAGGENFSAATANISSASQKLKTLAEGLNK